MLKFFKEKFTKKRKQGYYVIQVFDLDKEIISREMYAEYISIKYKTKVYQEINEKFVRLYVEGSEMWKKITDKECFSIWKNKNQPR